MMTHTSPLVGYMLLFYRLSYEECNIHSSIAPSALGCESCCRSIRVPLCVALSTFPQPLGSLSSALYIMFFHSLRATLIALAIATPSVYATPTLSLKVTCPRTVNGIEDLKVTTTVTNTRGKTVKILNGPNTITDSIPTNKFMIINTDGFSLDFIGVSAKHSPSQAATSMDSFDVITIAPGQSVSVTHDRRYLITVAYLRNDS